MGSRTARVYDIGVVVYFFMFHRRGDGYCWVVARVHLNASREK
jgi:hypothetical protein